MGWETSYTDICAELRIAQIHEMELRRRVELAHTAMVKGEMPSSGTYCHLPFDKGIRNFNEAVDELTVVQAEVDRLEGIKTQMEQIMQQFTGLAYVVQCKRLMERKSYAQISLELGYSESHLRNTVAIAKSQYKRSTKSANVA